MSLMCSRCGVEAERTTHKGEFAAACPNCEDILFRPVGEGLDEAVERIKQMVGGSIEG